MKFKRHIELEQGLRQIDIAPLIDVVFLLLVFFMLTSSFITPTGIRINLPRAVSSESLQSDSLILVVSAENVIYYKGKVLTKKELLSLLKKAGERKRFLLIKADQRSSLGKVVEVWDMCRKAGILKINIATESE